jgi:hypothetical protein
MNQEFMEIQLNQHRCRKKTFQSPRVLSLKNYKNIYVLALHFLLAIINMFIIKLYSHIIAYIDRTFKEEQNDINWCKF